MVITYKNGNRLIRINPETGYKERLVSISDINTKYIPYRPESLDINLSYKCNIGCEFCYLNAHPKGQEFKFSEYYLNKIFNVDITEMEIALNYNEGQDYYMTKQIINYFRNRGAIPNLTVNYNTFVEHINDMNGDVLGLNPYHFGISVTTQVQIGVINQLNKYKKFSVVFHIINGMFSGLEEIKNSKLLILGYKELGRGKKFSNENDIIFFTKKEIDTLLENGNTIAFDNLAIKQLGIELDDKHYLGDDGEISFYIDLVYKKYGISSTSPIRWNIGNKDIIEMFNHVKEEVYE